MARYNPIIVAHHGTKYVVRYSVRRFATFDIKHPGQVEELFERKKDAVDHIKGDRKEEQDGWTDTVD